MPVLHDEQHERFAQAVVRGLPRGKAYFEAGFIAKNEQSAAVQASKLVKKFPEINERMDELYAEARAIVLNAEFKGSVEELAKLFLEDREFARNQKQAGAAVSASAQLMKLFEKGADTIKGTVIAKVVREVVDPASR